MEKIAAFHELNYKKRVQVLTEVPGVVTIMGAFSDFCNGFCIAGTGALGLRVALSDRDDNTVRVYDATKGDKKHFQLTSLKYRKEDRWANYVKGVFAMLADEGVRFPHGYDITLKGALLYCDRITVSESIIMGMLMALDGSLELGYTRKDFIRIAYRVATEYCSISIRLRDLITVSYAQPGKVFHFDLQSSSYELMDYPFMNSEDPRGGGLYAIIVDPSLPPQILRDEIEEKRADAHDCCRELRKHLPQDYTLRTYPINDLKSHIIRDLDEHVRHTCEYVISETRLVERGRQALKDADGRMFGRCLSNIYIGMRDVFDVTCPEVDWLIRRAGEVDGVYGACYVSNGDSGSIFMVLDRKGEQDFVRCMDDYKRIFDFRAKTRPFMPGGPAHVVREVE